MTNSMLEFKIKNVTFEDKEKKYVIYLTNDHSINELVLTITNISDQTIVFSSNQNIFSLNFNSFLEPEIIENLRIVGNGWQSNFDSENYRTWDLKPTNDIEFHPNQSVDFTLTNIKVAGEKDNAKLDITYSKRPKTLTLFLINPPDSKLKELDSHNFYFGDNYNKVFVGENDKDKIVNTLKLIFNNPHPIQSPKLPNSSINPEKPPYFRVYFLAGDELGCLATKEDINKISINVDKTYGNDWDVPPPDEQSDIKSWKLIPKNNEILGTGNRGFIDFIITNIQSNAFIEGVDQGHAYMYIQCRNIPGYNDGVVALKIEKEFIGIINFKVSEFICKSPNSPSITIQWATSLGTVNLYKLLDENLNGMEPILLQSCNSTRDKLDLQRLNYKLDFNLNLDNFTTLIYNFKLEFTSFPLTKDELSHTNLEFTSEYKYKSSKVFTIYKIPSFKDTIYVDIPTGRYGSGLRGVKENYVYGECVEGNWYYKANVFGGNSETLDDYDQAAAFFPSSFDDCPTVTGYCNLSAENKYEDSFQFEIYKFRTNWKITEDPFGDPLYASVIFLIYIAENLLGEYELRSRIYIGNEMYRSMYSIIDISYELIFLKYGLLIYSHSYALDGPDSGGYYFAPWYFTDRLK